MKYLFLILISVTALVGCTLGEDPIQEKEQTIATMKPITKTSYNVIAFFEQINFDLQAIDNNDTDLLEQSLILQSMGEIIPLEKVETLSVSINKKHFEIFDIESFPTFLILDHSGIVLQTTDIVEVVNLLNSTSPNF